MKDPDCVFCKIIRGEIPSFKICETDKYLAILDISQFVEGHTIVIPKTHVETVWDMDDAGTYWEFVQAVGRNFLDKGFKFVDTLSFGRMVRHTHMHLIPHNNDDGDWKKATFVIGSFQQDPGRKLTTESGEKVASRFRFTL